MYFYQTVKGIQVPKCLDQDRIANPSSYDSISGCLQSILLVLCSLS